MATYSNQHWLLSHIRNSFISTDDTGMCETVMLSDDLPKHYLRKFQRNNNNNGSKSLDPPLQEVDFICYPGLDQSDNEDGDLSSQSFDIQMFPEVGAYRFRSNTAQKLEKMDIARRKAARTRSVSYDDEIVPPERADFFVKKALPAATMKLTERLKESQPEHAFFEGSLKAVADEQEDSNGVLIKSKLSIQLANNPKQALNKFMEYARFDGTSQNEFQTKRINVFLSMLPEKERNYPIKICVLATAKIIEVIGLVCYKATIEFPDIPLKSIRHYALYMTEDNDDMEDFPPLDNREPCSKFGFSHLTLAERRPLAPVTRVEYHNNLATKSMTSEEDKARLAAAAVRSLQGIELNGSINTDIQGDSNDAKAGNEDEHVSDYEARMLSHNDMLEAPLYRTYRLQIIDRRFFKTEVTLGISGDRIEIDQHKNAKFWTKQKAVTHPIDSVAFCEILERRQLKAALRIWFKASSTAGSSSSPSVGGGGDAKSATLAVSGGGNGGASTLAAHSPNSPGQYSSSSHFTLFPTSLASGSQQHSSHIRFKHYDFEADAHVVEQIFNKLNCILKVRSSEVSREFMHLRERKQEKMQAKKHLKM